MAVSAPVLSVPAGVVPPRRETCRVQTGGDLSLADRLPVVSSSRRYAAAAQCQGLHSAAGAAVVQSETLSTDDTVSGLQAAIRQPARCRHRLRSVCPRSVQVHRAPEPCLSVVRRRLP